MQPSVSGAPVQSSGVASCETVAIGMVMVANATFGSFGFPGQFLCLKKKDQQFMEPQCEITLVLIHDIFLRLYNVSFF